jgi:hypothetical protein
MSRAIHTYNEHKAFRIPQKPISSIIHKYLNFFDALLITYSFVPRHARWRHQAFQWHFILRCRCNAHRYPSRTDQEPNGKFLYIKEKGEQKSNDRVESSMPQHCKFNVEERLSLGAVGHWVSQDEE